MGNSNEGGNEGGGFTTLQVSLVTAKTLAGMKLHPRQSYDEVLRDLLRKPKPVRGPDWDVLEARLRAVEIKMKKEAAG